MLTCAVVNEEGEWSRQVIGEKQRSRENFQTSAFRADGSGNVVLGKGLLKPNKSGMVQFGKVSLH
jgi:hypothetical protein